MKSDCPLCGASSRRRLAPTGDWERYDCPSCGSFEISGAEEAVVRANDDAASAHRERLAQERERGMTIHRVGEINKR